MTARPREPAGGAARARALFFGSGAFGVPVLEALHRLPGIEVVTVVTTPDRPAGRGRRLEPVPVAARARSLGLRLLQPAGLRDPAAQAAIEATEPDVAVLADYGRLVPPAILAVPRRGFLNLHPSLLPRHRGATPIAAAILAGDAETGVTLFAMDAGLDTGPIVAQRAWRLTGDETAEGLEVTAAERAASLLARYLPRWLSGEARTEPQDEAAATLTRPFRREDGRLDPSRPARELERRVRALWPWPGSFVETRDTRLAVVRAAVGEAEPGDEPGTIVADGEGIALTTAAGCLRLLEVRPAAGRSMSGAALRRGHGQIIGQRVVGPVVEPAQRGVR